MRTIEHVYKAVHLDDNLFTCNPKPVVCLINFLLNYLIN